MATQKGTQIIDITDEAQFNSTISSLPSNNAQIIYFHAPWAEPCKQMSTVISALASTYPPTTPPTITFLSLDAESLSDISETYEVTQVPFIVIQRDGKTLDTLSGGEPSRVRALVEKHAGPPNATSTSSSTSTLPPAQKVTPRTTTTIPETSSTTNPQSESTLTPPQTNEEDSKKALDARLSELVRAAPVMLFMKGTPSSPQCGFSRQTVAMLRERGIRYGFFNILADDDVRQGLKAYSEWPTFPQLYVAGELVGGLDIVSFHS